MKLFFVKEDSIYKVFKTIEKIPKGKSVEIFIDPDHTFFQNDRWASQIKDIITKKSLEVTFLTKNKNARDYLKNNWLTINHTEISKFRKTLSVLYMFFFNFKKFYLHSYDKKNYIFYVITLFEIIFGLIILYLLYSLVLPSVTLNVQPSHDINSIIYNFRYYPAEQEDFDKNSRYINIPYHSWYIDYKYDLSIDTQNIKYMSNSSAGKIKIINNTNQNYDFVPNTRFITEDGLLFKTNSWLAIPAWIENVPWEATIYVSAMEKDDFGHFMWSNWNISKNTKLYVKNVKQSYFMKNLYAITLEDFSWGNVDSSWTIESGDVQILENKLTSYITENQIQIAKENFAVKDALLITIPETISSEILSTNVYGEVWEQKSKIKGTTTSRIYFYYIKWEDLITWFEKYIKDRPMQQNTVISIDKDSIYFFEDYENKYVSDNVFIIPTKINVVEWYDFQKDINWIVTEIKEDILNQTRNEALQQILEYDEISAVDIEISPFWSNSITNVKSRINIETME